MKTSNTREDAWLFILIGLVLALFCFGSNGEANSLKPVLEKKIRQIAVEEGLDPDLVLAIAHVESRMNPRAIGSQGEVGLFQLKKEYHRTNGTIFEQIRVAVEYLKAVRAICEPKYGEAWFIGYNLGPHYAKEIKHPTLFPYYIKVMGTRERLASK